MHTEINTYFTRPNGRSELVYSAESWVRIKLQLETAGPVAVGTRQEITPVLSGKGILLPTTGTTLTEFIMPKGDRLFIASESINRVKYITEPIPWLEQMLYQIEQGFSSLKGIFGSIARRR